MIYLNSGSHTCELIRLLALTGEFPYRSLTILGNELSWRTLVRKLNKPQDFLIPESDFRHTCRMLSISGKSSQKSIRLYKGGLPVLQAIDPEGYAYYMENYGNHPFSGNEGHVDRNHRIAEAIAMLNQAGVQTEPFLLPKLQEESFRCIIPEFPCMYHSREIKMLGTYEEKKYHFTRLVGAVFADGRCYALYNTRDTLMKWNGKGEEKMKDNLNALCRMNAGIQKVDAAILFGKDEQIALRTLMSGGKQQKNGCRFDSIYKETHFIPMSADGIRLLQLLMLPDAKENLLSTLFTPNIRSYDRGGFEYDAKVGKKIIFSHIDGDLSRLIRFREAAKRLPFQFDVLCLSFQEPYLEQYLDPGFSIHVVDLQNLEEMIRENMELDDEV